jgi:hypothetical protein
MTWKLYDGEAGKDGEEVGSFASHEDGKAAAPDHGIVWTTWYKSYWYDGVVRLGVSVPSVDEWPALGAGCYLHKAEEILAYPPERAADFWLGCKDHERWQRVQRTEAEA